MIRIFGFTLCGLFALCGAIIGFGSTDAYLSLSFFQEYSLIHHYHSEATLSLTALGGLVGFLMGSVLYRHVAGIARNLKVIPVEDKVAWMVGTVFSVLPAFMLATVVLSFGLSTAVTSALIMLECAMVLLLGNIIALSMKDQLKFLVRGADSNSGNAAVPAGPATGPSFKLLDASCIIDGRVFDILRCGFMGGQVFIPAFVVKELQHLAGAQDPLRRNRGKRGLDVLQRLQNEIFPPPEVLDRVKTTFTPGEAIYTKLIKLAREIGNADVVTCDHNLIKVAKPYAVTVLNVNELATALKPVLLPGEELVVTLVREGKEAHEAVGYLDDGSMVVVRDGRRKLDSQVHVGVVSVTHTVAGKMIFADLRDESA